MLNAERLEALEALKRQVVAQLELRRNLFEGTRKRARRKGPGGTRTRASDRKELQEALDGIKKAERAPAPLSTACRFNLVVPADPAAIPAVADGVMQIVDEKHCAEGRRVEVEIALREALANAIKHGCKNDSTKSVQCCVALKKTASC